MQTLFSALVLISSFGIIGSVVLQEGDDGMASLGGSAPRPLFGKNKEVSKDATLQRITVISAAVFMISTLILAAN
ncbi:MAG TPA: preprotein translocase subunit SecG [Tissierellaceae bacterium]